MHPPSLRAQAGVRFSRRERTLPAVDPARLLEVFEGQARGFWGRGDRWVAWGGALARIEVAPGAGGSRFDHVRREAARILGGTPEEWVGRSPSDRPRFFGGFAFLEPRVADPVWRGFAPAAFVLPRVVLEGSPSGCRLLVRSRAGGAGEEAGVRDRGSAEEEVGGTSGERRAADELERITAILSAAPHGPDPFPSTPSSSTPVALDPRDRPDWDAAVRTVLRAVERGEVRKAVLARVLDARLAHPAEAAEVLRFLRRENRRAHVFLFEPHRGRIFFGAAPEILAELRGGCFQATAVAGSMARGLGVAEDGALARRLLASAKDRTEHLLTAEEMTEVLQPRLEGMEVEEEPRILRLARIQHLETVIRGRVAGAEDVLALVEALHPTPAVCGRPRQAALELIHAAEPFDRGWYAGPVGWFDPAGDGDFVPALRSAVGGGARWRLFAGAGVVSGSDPSDEWDETALKFEPALRALGVVSG